VRTAAAEEAKAVEEDAAGAAISAPPVAWRVNHAVRGAGHELCAHAMKLRPVDECTEGLASDEVQRSEEGWRSSLGEARTRSERHVRPTVS
jgi:peptidoglycan/xylan/chitin deacetylase (PgdA/CDA1 family)